MTFANSSLVADKSQPTDGRDDRATTRFLPSCGSAPALEFLEIGPRNESRGAPILCLHGAFDGAWMWREIFQRAFSEFREPPIVIAHSLGALIAQRLLSIERMCPGLANPGTS